MPETRENTTLFVRNIPFHLTKDKLEDRFSEFGPIKQCFIVNDKVSGKSRGFGYVKFTLLEDAKKAKEGDISLEGRTVTIDYADISKKIKKTPRIQKKIEEKEDDVYDDREDEKTDFCEKEEKESDDEKVKTNAKSGQNMKYHKAKIVALTGMPDSITSGELNNCLHKMGVKHLAECKLLTDGKEAHLKFKCIRDAKRAIRKLHNHSYKDSMFQAVQMSEDVKGQQQHLLKKSRLIVRNLAFQCNEEQLEKAFGHCGEITEVKIPSNQAGKKLGFGFVQFTRLAEAKNAVEEMNKKKILGRPVAVDWALPKAKYENTQQQNEKNLRETEESSSSDDLPSGDERETHKKPTQLRKQRVGDVSSDDEDDGDESSDEEEEKEDDVSDEEMDVGKGINDDDDDDDDDADDDDDDAKQKDNKNAIKKTKTNVPQKSDTDDGCTLFLRNLSYDTTEEGLNEYCSQYGELKYAKIVYNHETEHSKGIGFVRYMAKQSADKCLHDAKEGMMSIDGRQLMVSIAVSREKAADFTEKKKKEKEKDSRNLYLAREGMVRPGTQSAEGLSKVDLDKRMKVEALKRQKLKNLDIFISPLRLCVRNIPVTVDDKKLREVFKTAAGEKSVQINECRIMRDRARTNAEGTGKSKGYGFVSFSDHQHALAALRHTNNNPEMFGDKRRLIVEFSLENRRALEAKEKRKFKQKDKMTKKVQTGDRKANIQHTKKSSVIPLIQLSEKDKKLKGDKLQKGLPSHWGPKIRHRARPAQTSQGKKAQTKQQLQKGQNAQKRKQFNQQEQGPVQKKQKKTKSKETHDDFDKIVNKYKNKLIGKKETGKWFQ